MVFSKEDMNLTWIAWIAKNGKLKSDAIDGVFEPPYAFIGDIEVVDSNSGKSYVATNNDSPVEPVAPEADGADIVDMADSAGDGTFLDELDSMFDIPTVERARGRATSMTDDELDAEVQWLYEQLGVGYTSDDSKSSGLLMYDNPISTSGNMVTMGALRARSIVLWRGAEKGTLYHEAFHYVSLGALSRARRMKIYQSVRNEVEGMATATDKEVEEYLAEDFREYKLNGTIGSKAVTSKKTFKGIRNFFRRIMAIVRNMIGMTDGDIARLYRDIDAGVFKKFADPSKKMVRGSNLAEFNAKYGDKDTDGAFRVADLGMKHITDAKLLNSIVDGLAFMAMHLGGVHSISDVSSINNGINMLISRIKSDMSKLPEDKRNVYQDVLDNFESIFLPRMNRIFKGMDIKVVDDTDAAAKA